MADNCDLKSPMSTIVGDYVFVERFVGAAPGTVPLCTESPDRCVLVIGNATGSSAYVTTRPNPGASEGLILSTQTPTLIMTSRDHPGLVWAAWYTTGMGLGGITVQEVYYRPRR